MKQGILVVNHGTADYDARIRTIDEFMLSIGDRYEEADIACAYTDGEVRRKLREETGEKIQNVKAAMLAMKERGVSHLSIVTTDILEDNAHKKIREEVGTVAALFSEVKISRPLLYADMDFELTARAAHGAFSGLVGGDALIVVTRGEKQAGDEELALFEKALQKHVENSYVVSLLGERRLYKAIKELKSKEKIPERVVLIPLEFIAGESIENDISSKYNELSERLAEEGFIVERFFKGIGEITEFQRLFLRHLFEA